jgi:4-hydroxybenzoate polyprenyltransferase
MLERGRTAVREKLTMDTFRKYVEKYLVLLRPRAMMLFLLPMTLGFACAAGQSDGVAGWRIASAYLAFLSMSFFASTLNFYSDVEADRMHNDLYKDQPLSQQPFAAGEMGKVETPLVFMVSASMCVIFGLLAGWWFAVFIIATLLIVGVLYSHPWFHFKARPVLDVLTNTTGVLMLLIAGWTLAAPAGVWPPALPLVFSFILAAILYLPTVANDAPFDEAAGYRTSGVVFGAKRLLNAMIPLCAVLTVVGVPVLIGSFEWPFKLFIAITLPAAWVFTWGMHKLFEPPHIRFNTSLLIYPVSALSLFYFVYAVDKVLP